MAANGAQITAPASAAASFEILAQNFSRRGDASGPAIAIVNNSTAILYILLGKGTASATNFTYAMAAFAAAAPITLEIWGYRGPIQGVWAAANGNAIITEFL